MTSKEYKTVTYSVAIELPKSQKEVFDHLINLKQWWPEKFEGDDIRLNSEFVLTTGDSHYSRNKVIELAPEKKLAWLVTDSVRRTDGYDWTGTKMIFELSPEGDNTLIKFTYDGVVLEDEYERLVTICDLTLKEMFYQFIITGKGQSGD